MNSLEAFQILGLQNTASEEEIKATYRKLAKQWHPDINKEPDAGETFKQINRAYNLLIKPQPAKQRESPFISPFPNDLFEQFFGSPSSGQTRSTKSASLTFEMEDITPQLAEEIAQLIAEKGYKIKGYSYMRKT